MEKVVGIRSGLKLSHIEPLLPEYGKFNKEKFLIAIKKIASKFNKELTSETMINILNNVRKSEYQQDSEEYPYTINDIYDSLLYSNWNFEKPHYSPKEKLYIAIYGNSPFRINDWKKEDFINYVNEINLAEIIEQNKASDFSQRSSSKRM